MGCFIELNEGELINVFQIGRIKPNFDALTVDYECRGGQIYTVQCETEEQVRARVDGLVRWLDGQLKINKDDPNYGYLQEKISFKEGSGLSAEYNEETETLEIDSVGGQSGYWGELQKDEEDKQTIEDYVESVTGNGGNDIVSPDGTKPTPDVTTEIEVTGSDGNPVKVTIMNTSNMFTESIETFPLTQVGNTMTLSGSGNANVFFGTRLPLVNRMYLSSKTHLFVPFARNTTGVNKVVQAGIYELTRNGSGTRVLRLVACTESGASIQLSPYELFEGSAPSIQLNYFFNANGEYNNKYVIISPDKSYYIAIYGPASQWANLGGTEATLYGVGQYYASDTPGDPLPFSTFAAFEMSSDKMPQEYAIPFTSDTSGNLRPNMRKLSSPFFCRILNVEE